MQEVHPQQYSSKLSLTDHLDRLARFGANLADAHSCFIFLPTAFLSSTTKLAAKSNLAGDAALLSLMGFHSLSNDILRACNISLETGLIGWVGKHRRAIHVSPFEHDSRTLGVYGTDQDLKSFIGIPVPLGFGESKTTDSQPLAALSGVLACDSKKSFAFSKLQGKLLEDLAVEIGHVCGLIQSAGEKVVEDDSWARFVIRSQALIQSLGVNYVDVLRLRITNFDEMEKRLGASKTLALVTQVYRLIEQTIPPHFPLVRLPQGDLVLVLDNMMTSFHENKIRAICTHVAIDNVSLSFNFSRRSLGELRGRASSFEMLLADGMREALPTSNMSTNNMSVGNMSVGEQVKINQAKSSVKEGRYEYRRA